MQIIQHILHVSYYFDFLKMNQLYFSGCLATIWLSLNGLSSKMFILESG